MLSLTAKIKVTGLYTGQSKFPFWKVLQLGDELILSVKLSSPGRASRGLYATVVNIENITQKTEFGASLTEAANYLSKITYTE